ncbi:5-carboxymethyl-2-hydroxymuconate isomerase [Microvirga tunisiensis]|uniref:5-carboxymethyl-2-hydroxymuconate isomerase n=2 Tax=Pannonibacter tanglangensis TaxID=2750084 RepID=A0ABW9ZIA4_9HYPH|nr:MULTISPECIES: 5-carboxymethyl-2-hydroxymuconate isomerase [unclassified Pannonibacter]NBN62445.1 5-carboxymethyl-2-hydroxymuconate isomerase [Pannonibacter sp. XCT-34]NBN78101.1 5-carboxymethyl-2-hydroxymuconate isomerase [Pannonibacter sp. XCT-53]
MPHLILQYGGPVPAAVDMTAACQALHAAMLATGLFELGAIRVRALKADAAAIGDLLPENAFVDLVLRIGVGRSAEEKTAAGEAIFAAAAAVFSPLLSGAHFALSLEIVEIDPALSWKRNTMHPRLRTAGKERP